MCGLFGVIKEGAISKPGIERARLARDTLSHRGPDQTGEYFLKNTYMGHRRLSILDTSDAGKQPMVARNVAVTVNGEVYNFQSLKSELEEAGYKFRSQSDSEVLLHGYSHWGIDGLVNRLDGMYAAVIHDAKTQQLYAFRDRVGIKPFYYYHGTHQFVWASELKAICSFLPASGLSPDVESLIDFLVYRYIPAPKTAYLNCFKLPPASILKCDTKDLNVEIRTYWRLRTEAKEVPENDLEEQLRDLLEKSVKDQLVSDVPLGLLLSGGIDSSTVAAIAAKYKPSLNSFSVGFKSSNRDETPYALSMAKHVGTNHRVHYLENEEMSCVFDRMYEWFGEPFADTSAVPTHRVCSFARNHVKVALSGDGGDELFGGYRWYQNYSETQKHSKWMPLKFRYGNKYLSKIPILRDLELASISDPLWQYARLRGSISHARVQYWKERLGVSNDYDPLWAYRANYNAKLPTRKAAQIMDFHTYLPDDILTKVDRVSMAVSLECRPPLLSRSLVEFAFRLTERFLYRGKGLKTGLKKTVQRLLPSKVLEHSKQGFSVPDNGWRRALIKSHGSFQESLIHDYLKRKS